MGEWDDMLKKEGGRDPKHNDAISEDNPTSPSHTNGQQPTYATWFPKDIHYSDVFENGLQQALEQPPTGHDGITIISDNTTTQPEPGVSIRAKDIDAHQLPTIAFDELPLPLDDPRRIYTSAIPGVRLTHPAGYFEGGPPHAPEDDDTFVRDFIAQNNITDPASLRDIRDREIQQCLVQVKQRMKARQEALQHNARIEKEIKTLTDQREMELKIENNMRDEQKAKAERREKRRMKHAG